MNDIRKVLSYTDVLLMPRNSELEHISDANLKIDFFNTGSQPCLPIINSPMDTVCSPELIKLITDTYDMPSTIHRWFKSPEEQIKFFDSCNLTHTWRCFLAVGMVAKWKEWIDKLLEYREHSHSQFGILVDVANGDTTTTVNTVKYIKSSYEAQKSFGMKLHIMAGNVATRSGFARLQDVGADFIRCGIGSGAICSTRSQTGFGLPVLTSIFDCAKVKDKSYLVADGGIESNGDICKAMAAGADLVMCGKLFAGTSLANNKKFDKDGNVVVYTPDYGASIECCIIPENELPPPKCYPPLVPSNPIKYCSYRGMASKESIDNLNSKKSGVSIEGVSGMVPYTGETKDVIESVIGNLQSAMAYYAGSRNWDEFKRKVKFVEITSSGLEESKTRVL